MEPTRPELLTERDKLEIDYLKNEAGEEEFRHAVSEWIDKADKSGTRVFRSRELIKLTHAALTELVRQSGEKRMRAPNKRSAAAHRMNQDKFRAERGTIAAIIKAEPTRQRKPRVGDEKLRALRVLADLHPAQYRRIANRFANGATAREVLESERAADPVPVGE